MAKIKGTLKIVPRAELSYTSRLWLKQTLLVYTLDIESGARGDTGKGN